jgi:hypothetical protein
LTDYDPPELSLTDEERQDRKEVMSRLDNWATNLDARFRIPFTPIRFGLDPLIGLVPALGPLLGVLLSVYIFGSAFRYKVPLRAILRMVSNIGIEFIVGLIPVLGPMFDVYWRANIRNVDLLREHLTPEVAARERREKRLLRLRQFGLSLLVLASVVAVVYFWQNDLLGLGWLDGSGLTPKLPVTPGQSSSIPGANPG